MGGNFQAQGILNDLCWKKTEVSLVWSYIKHPCTIPVTNVSLFQCLSKNQNYSFTEVTGKIQQECLKLTVWDLWLKDHFIKEDSHKLTSKPHTKLVEYTFFWTNRMLKVCACIYLVPIRLNYLREKWKYNQKITVSVINTWSSLLLIPFADPSVLP